MTNTTPAFSPAGLSFVVVVFGSLPGFQLYVVPSGKLSVFTLSFATGVTPLDTLCFGSFAVGAFPDAVPFASVLSTSSVVIAFVFTEVLSLTSASLILIVPVFESIVNGVPSSSSQPVSFLVAV